LLYDFGHGECFARACNAEQDLIAFAFSKAFAKLLNRIGLIAFGFKFRDKFKSPSTLGFYGAIRAVRNPD